MSHWKRLAFLPQNEGSTTGNLRLSNSSFLETSDQLFSSQSGVDAWWYYRLENRWYTRGASGSETSPFRQNIRQNVVEFRLSLSDDPATPFPATFYGLGTVSDDRLPEKQLYLRDWRWREGNLGPDPFPGETGEYVWFVAANQGYILTQNSRGTMYAYAARSDAPSHWRQRAGFPEKPVSLAAFSANDIGYVLNQRAGEPPRLFAFDPKADRWTRKADFPGSNRTQGFAFSVQGRGYYGLGTAGDQALRDLWQYNPAADRWQYLTEANPCRAFQLLVKSRFGCTHGQHRQLPAVGPAGRVFADVLSGGFLPQKSPRGRDRHRRAGQSEFRRKRPATRRRTHHRPDARPKRDDHRHEPASAGHQEFEKIPVVFGEVDILKALILQPGVTTVGEGAGGFNVRGGRTDQNLVLLDGAPIFNTSHLLGFLSNLNADAIQDAVLFKGNLPAAYGGRLSSLLLMNTKTGNPNSLRGSVGIGLLTSRVLAEGPVSRNHRLTFVVGGRRTPTSCCGRFPRRPTKTGRLFTMSTGG